MEKFKDFVKKNQFWLFAAFLIIAFTTFLLLDGGFYVYNSDDYAQYMPFMKHIIHSIKDGSFSLYDIRNNHGGSITSFIYYFPLDIFTLLIFLLDYIIPFEIAFEITTVIKLIAGVLIFYQVLKKRGLRDDTLLIGSFLFLIAGGLTSTLIYSSFVSLYFYIPIVLYFIENVQKRKYLFSLLACTLFMYSFYNTYLIIINVFLVNEIIKMYEAEKLDKGYFKERLSFILPYIMYTLIGLLMASFVVMPGIVAVLSSERSTNMSLWHYDIMRFINLFISTIFPLHGLDFIESQDYIQTQASLYMTSFGLLIITNVLMDKENRNKKIALALGIAAVLIIPILSIPLNGVGVYARWFFGLNLLFIYFITKHLNDNKEVKVNFLFIVFFLLGTALFITKITKLPYMFADPLRSMQFFFIEAFMLLVYVAINFKKKLNIKYFMLPALVLSFIFIFRTPDVIEENKGYTRIDTKIEEVNSFVDDTVDNKNDLILFPYKSYSGLNMAYNSEHFFSNNYIFHSFMNKDINDYYNFTTYDFNGGYWHLKQEQENPMKAAIENVKYFVVEKEEGIPDMFNTKMFIKLKEDDKYILYKNVYAFDGMLYYDTFSKTTDPNSNLVNMLNKIYFKTDNEEMVKEDITEHLFKAEFNTNSEIEIKLSFDDNYFYYYKTNELNDLIPASDNVTVYGTNLSWTGDSFKLKSLKPFSSVANIKIIRIPKAPIFDALDKQRSINNIESSFNNDKFYVTGKKAKGHEAYVTIPYSYKDNIKADKYEIMSGNGGFITIKLPKDVEEFEVNLTYSENNTIPVIATILGLGSFIIVLIASEIIIKRED